MRAVGVVEERVVDRGRPGEHGDALAFDHLERDPGVEHGEREDRRAPHEAREAARLVTEDVEERVRDEVAVAGAKVGPVAPVEIPRSVWPCVITTPFGLPVVPDVNTTSLGSSAPIDSTRASRHTSAIDVPALRKSAQVIDASSASPASRMVCWSAGNSMPALARSAG